MAAELQSKIRAVVAELGLEVEAQQIEALALHGHAVLEAPQELHLTSIVDHDEFVRRHIGESIQGVDMLPHVSHVSDASNVGSDEKSDGESDAALQSLPTLLDVGSGNGYPGIVLGIMRPDLRLVLGEASGRKAEFLAQVIEKLTGDGQPGGVGSGSHVHHAHIERSADVDRLGALTAISSRATGGWDRFLPRLAPALLPGAGRVVLWAGEDVESARRRKLWKRLDLVERRLLAGRERSWIWSFQTQPELH